MIKRIHQMLGTAALLTSWVYLLAGAPSAADPPANPFYAMDTNLRDGKARTPEETAKRLKDLGYAGYGHGGMKDIDRWLNALGQEGLRLFNTYVGLNLDADPLIDPELPATIRQFEGTGTMLWLFVQSQKYQRAAEDGDGVAVAAIRQLADTAHEHHVKIALYPHTGFYVESTDDAIRIARKVNRRNVGVTLNLCHWLKVDGEQNLQALMQRALPYLFQVTINGADRGDTRDMNWDRLIQPLDAGSFDVSGFLNTLWRLGYDGPIGLQGYGIPGDSEVNLKRSIHAWTTIRDHYRTTR